MIEIDPKIAWMISDKNSLLTFLLKRLDSTVEGRVIDDNKLYCSELLAVLIIDKSNQNAFVRIGGI